MFLRRIWVCRVQFLWRELGQCRPLNALLGVIGVDAPPTKITDTGTSQWNPEEG